MSLDAPLSLSPGLPDPVRDARFYDGVPGRRLFAFVVDTAAIVALTLLATLVFGVLSLGVGLLLFAPIGVAVTFAYRAAAIAQWSATPGMALVGIELRRADGARFGPLEAVIHTALFMLAFFMAAPQILSIVMMAMGRPGRGLHDLVLGSTAINRPA
ncbi:MAG: RDD family protein [Rubrimonas sp.]